MSDINPPQTPSEEQIDRLDNHVKDVASRLPFPTQLEADMGDATALQIDLGTRGAPDDPHDHAGIDGTGPDDRWWIETHYGEYQEISDLGADANPEDIARWISERATALGAPAAAAINTPDPLPISRERSAAELPDRDPIEVLTQHVSRLTERLDKVEQRLTEKERELTQTRQALVSFANQLSHKPTRTPAAAHATGPVAAPHAQQHDIQR